MNKVYITSYSSISAIGAGISDSLDNLYAKKNVLKNPQDGDKFSKPYFPVEYELGIDKDKIRCSQLVLSLLSHIEEEFKNKSSNPLFLATCTGGIKETEDIYKDSINNNVHYPVFERHFFNRMYQDIDEAYPGLISDSCTLSTACSSAAHSLIQAFRFIKNGIIDKALVIGVDALSLTTMVGFDSLKLVSSKGTKPLTVDRDGLSLGEGSGVVLLESNPESDPIAEVIGGATTSDGYHISSPDPNGVQQKECVLKAVKEAGIDFSEIDYINAHGTGTVVNDQVEMELIKSLFSPSVTVTSTKSFVGHTLGASAVIELALALGMLQADIIFQPENMGEFIAPEYIPEKSLRKKVKYFLKNSFGFGGNNASFIIKNHF